MKRMVFPPSAGGLTSMASPSSPSGLAGLVRNAPGLAKRFFFAAARTTSTREEAEVPESGSSSETSIVATLGLVLTLTVVGDAVAEALALPVPGAAVGMLILAGVFALRGGVDLASGRIFDAAAPHFPLFFIPAAAGIVASSDLLTSSWFPIAAAIVLGTAITLVITGMLTQILLQRLAKVKTP